MSETIWYDVRVKLGQLDSDLKQAEAKLEASKKKIEAKGLLVKLDIPGTDKQVDQLFKSVEKRLGRPLKLDFDTSKIEAKISQLEARMARLGGSGVPGMGPGGGGSQGGLAGLAAAAIAGRASSRSNMSSSAGRSTYQNIYDTDTADGTGNFLGRSEVIGRNRSGSTVTKFDVAMKKASRNPNYVPPDDTLLGESEDGLGFNSISSFVRSRSLRSIISRPRSLGSRINSLSGGRFSSLQGSGQFSGAGIAGGVGAVLGGAYAVSQYLDGVGNSQFKSMTDQRSIDRGENFSSDDQFNNAINKDTLSRYTLNIPVINGIGRGFNNYINAKSNAEAKIASERADRVKGAFDSVKDSGFRSAANSTDDPAQLARIATEQEINGINRSAAEKARNLDPSDYKAKGAIFRAAETEVATVQQKAARLQARQDRRDAAAIQVNDLSGVDDRAAERVARNSKYDTGNPADRAIRDSEQRASDRAYNRTTGFMGQQNAVNALAGEGFNMQAAIAQNKLNADQQRVGVTDPGRLKAIGDAQAQADRQVRKEFNISLREMTSNTKAAAQALGGNSLAGAITGINAQRNAALAREKDPMMQKAINDSADMQIKGARLEDARDKANYGLGTESITRGTSRQKMRNSGHYIQADAQSVIDEATLAIKDANINYAGDEKKGERDSRVAALRADAAEKLKGIKSEFRRGITTEGVSAYQIMAGAGGAGENGDLAKNAFQDINKIDSQMAGAEKGYDAANKAPDSMASIASEILDWVKKCAENVGVTE